MDKRERDVLHSLCNGDITFSEAAEKLGVTKEKIEELLEDYSWVPSPQRLAELHKSEMETLSHIREICRPINKMTINSHIAKNIMRIGEIEEIEPNLIKTPMIGDLCTEMYHKVEREKPVTSLANGVRIIMYIEGNNFAVRPPLGEIIRLHQAYEGTDVCLYCGKPVKEWKSMEKCPAR
jgi:hypothetical protein